MSDESQFLVRMASEDDLSAVLSIERVSFGDAWSRGMFTWHLRQPSTDLFVVACEAAQAVEAPVVGYAIARVVDSESELFNIAVHPTRRGEGIGSILLDATMHWCASTGAAEMWLEVRASNEDAFRLYASRGFVAMGQRKGYYNSPREDALVLRGELGEMPAGSKTIHRADAGLLGRSGDPILSSASQPTRQETI